MSSPSALHLETYSSSSIFQVGHDALLKLASFSKFLFSVSGGFEWAYQFSVARSCRDFIRLASQVKFHWQRLCYISYRFFGLISVPSQRWFFAWLLILLRKGAGWLSSFLVIAKNLIVGKIFQDGSAVLYLL